MAARASWEWVLADSQGNGVAELSTASARILHYRRNYYQEASCVISHQDAAATPLLAMLQAGAPPQLLAYRRSAGATTSVLRFRGYLAPFTEALEESALMTLTFRSPFARLFGDGSSGYGRYTDPSIACVSQSADGIAAALINLYGGAGAPLGATDPVFGIPYAETSHAGLGIGNIGASTLWTIGYTSANIGESIIDLSSTGTGFDFDETPVAAIGPVLANFNTYYPQGSVQAATRFEYGPGTLRNLSRVERTTAPPITVVIAVGAGGITSQQEDVGASGQYGRWYYQVTATGISSQALLDAYALGLLRPAPVQELTVFPEMASPSCPLPWDNYWLGDTVGVYVNRGGFVVSAQARINSLDLAIDDNGFETSTLPQPSTSGTAAKDAPDVLHSQLGLSGGINS